MFITRIWSRKEYGSALQHSPKTKQNKKQNKHTKKPPLKFNLNVTHEIWFVYSYQLHQKHKQWYVCCLEARSAFGTSAHIYWCVWLFSFISFFFFFLFFISKFPFLLAILTNMSGIFGLHWCNWNISSWQNLHYWYSHNLSVLSKNSHLTLLSFKWGKLCGCLHQALQHKIVSAELLVPSLVPGDLGCLASSGCGCLLPFAHSSRSKDENVFQTHTDAHRDREGALTQLVAQAVSSRDCLQQHLQRGFTIKRVQLGPLPPLQLAETEFQWCRCTHTLSRLTSTCKFMNLFSTTAAHLLAQLPGPSLTSQVCPLIQLEAQGTQTTFTHTTLRHTTCTSQHSLKPSLFLSISTTDWVLFLWLPTVLIISLLH